MEPRPVKLQVHSSARELDRVRAFVEHHWPELGVLLVGIVFRASMAVTYDVTAGYDFVDHLPYLEWFRDRLQFPFVLPDLLYCREAYHPPLYYVLGGAAMRAFGSIRAVQGMGILFGVARLALIWYGLQKYVPSRLARIAGLSLAAVLPAQVHLEGMTYGEPLNNLLAVIAVLVLMRLFTTDDHRRRLRLGAGLGLVIGLLLLTKVSGLLLVVLVGLTAAIDIYLRRPVGDWRHWWRRVAPVAVAGAIVLAVAGPYYLRNQLRYGKMFLSGWDGPDKWQVAQSGAFTLPYLERRPIGFFVGWTNDVLEAPYWSSGIYPHHRFWPVLIATTYVDYYNYGFAPKPRGRPVVYFNGRPVPVASMLPARLSVCAGTWIAAVVAIAWAVILRGAWRRRSVAELAVLLLPVLVIAGQMHFAIKYPLDSEGLVKGSYVQFGFTALFAVFGLATAWCWERRWVRPVVIANFAAVVLAAVYVAICRFT